MKTDITDQLYGSIDRLTESTRFPAGLVARAARRNHRRRIAAGASATAGVAMITTAAVAFASTAAIPRSDEGGQATMTTAYVVSRTEHAMAAASQKGAIERVQVMGIGDTQTPALIYAHGKKGAKSLVIGPIPDFPALDSQRITAWSYGGRYREEGFTMGGRPLYDYGVLATTGTAGQGGAGHIALVDYPAKTWYSNISLSGEKTAPPSCGNAPDPDAMTVGTAADWSSMLRVALRCGQFKVAGRQWIQGIHAIKIVSDRQLLKNLQTFGGLKGTLWVDPKTYLPLRVLWTWKETGKLSGDFQWLPPTRANLAMLNTTIPLGFRAVRVPAGTQIGAEGMMEVPRP